MFEGAIWKVYYVGRSLYITQLRLDYSVERAPKIDEVKRDEGQRASKKSEIDTHSSKHTPSVNWRSTYDKDVG